MIQSPRLVELATQPGLAIRHPAQDPLSRRAACAHLRGQWRMSPSHVRAFFETLKRVNPSPQTELEYTNVFELLTAVLLSAQATDVSVNKATKGLFAAANTPARMLALGVEGVSKQIRSIGLYPTKAKNLIATCRILVDQYGGKVPDTREALETLPGVGRKTANVVLNVAFGKATMAVDTHIFRVSNRTGLASGKTPLEVEQALLRCVPQEYLVDAHHWLILLGRYVCQARKPQCTRCAVADYCAFPTKTSG